jgi:amidase
MQDVAFMDATDQADLVRRREASPLELVEGAIERIEALNPQINAVVTPMYEQARAAAREPLPDGPFAGVPYLVKDLTLDVAGVRMASGTRFLRDFVSQFDAELYVRQRRAGLIPVGKTNTPEFGILPTTEPVLFGPTHNPWNLDRSPGGSSGGSAAAVAAGIVPLAHASDGGGSIRIPASCCGLFGLKPTRMRTPLGPALGDGLAGLPVEHAVTRSVRDSAALLDATSGPDQGAPYFAAPPERPFLQEVGTDPGRLRVAVTREAMTGTPVDPECVAAVEESAKLCAELGHEVFDFAPGDLDIDAFVSAFLVVWNSGAAAGIEHWARSLGRDAAEDQFEPLTWAMRGQGLAYSAVDYFLAQAELQLLSRKIAGWFQGFDVWLTPVLAEPPVPLGTFDAPADNPMFPLMRASLYVPFTPLANVTGMPAMSVPLHWTADGLPVGSHFVGRYGDEATLLRLAAQLEAARPWAARRPPVSAEKLVRK